MSLNQSEQMVFDYIQRHPEERHYWSEKVRNTYAGFPDIHAVATTLDAELWRYFVERSGVASPFRETAQRQGLRRTSMRNLAELLIRLWTVPRKKPAAPPAADADQAPQAPRRF